MLWDNARRLVIAVIGFTVILIGVAMIVLPGPAFLVIPAGLAILATEFVWAKRLLRKFKRTAKSLLPGGRATQTVEDEAEAAPHSGFTMQPTPPAAYPMPPVRGSEPAR